MSEIITNFTAYFEDSDELNNVFNGLAIHNNSNKEKSIDYFKSAPKNVASFLESSNFSFLSLHKEHNMIVGLIQGGSVTFNPEQFFESLASLGCTMSVTTNDFDQVGETEEFGFKGKRKVKSITVINALKKISPSFAFSFALTSNQSKLALELLDNGVNPNIFISNERHAIEFVASNSYWKILRKMIKSGANVNAQSPGSLSNSQVNPHYEGGMTAMHYVASYGDVGLLKMLVDRGANVDTQNVKGESSLHRAVNYESKKQVDFLVKNGADVNLKDKAGMTPFLSILNEPDYNLNTIKLFIANGADINLSCDKGGNALWYVNERSPVDQEAINYIKSFGINLQPPKNTYSGNKINNFKVAIQHGDEHFLNNNTLPTDPDSLVKLLLEAITTQRLSIVKRLLDANADPMRVVNLNNDIQIHSLDYARSDGSSEINKLLTEKCQAQLANEKEHHESVKAIFMNLLKYIDEHPLDYYKNPSDQENIRQLLGMKKYFCPTFFKKQNLTQDQELYQLKFLHDAANRPSLSNRNESIELKTLKENIVEATKLTEYNGNLSCKYQNLGGELLIVDLNTCA